MLFESEPGDGQQTFVVGRILLPVEEPAVPFVGEHRVDVAIVDTRGRGLFGC